ncbi:integumentary mucin C.1-like [Haliotis rubra]|uniref:integumentary mucin C.1-like n=1 Tax=Haliotis rubra TaxID=36100 RepID=UPI001EE554B2|nr:integumentary mucin C.1-like [Haliotis rubra]
MAILRCQLLVNRSSVLICQLIFVTSLGYSVVTAATKVCTDNSLLNNSGMNVDKRVTQTPYVILTTSGLMDCGVKCQRRKACGGVNFNVNTGDCELLGVAANQNSFTTETGWIHSIVAMFPKILSGNCADHTCTSLQYCEPSASSYSCISTALETATAATTSTTTQTTTTSTTTSTTTTTTTTPAPPNFPISSGERDDK